MKLAGGFHLTYCSNIHPGESWEEVRRNLGDHVPVVRDRLCPGEPFGIGLRLSAQAAQTLEEPGRLAEFQQFLATENLYVFTINGFPYGVFHRARVKEEVYLPDWKDEERLVYSNRLAHLLAAMLPDGPLPDDPPDQPRLEGSISTVPGAFKGEVRSGEDTERMAHLMLRHAAELHRIAESTGKTLTLALEPEPCCFIETTAEAVAFFRDFLFAPALLAGLAAELGISPAEAEAVARRHLGLCFDACHMAVEFEEMAASLAALRSAGIKIAKFQISSALKLRFRRGDGRPEEALRPFVESTYLHQVVERSPAGLKRFLDLPEALAGEAAAGKDAVGKGSTKDSAAGEEAEWRVHFHGPVFLEEMRNFQTTQTHLVELLEQIRRDPHCPYLEVETYTWDVLPPEYRNLELDSAIARELAWVRERMAP